MATFSTLEALSTLSTSVPNWNLRLDELNGQIAQRQIELARFTESHRPPARSVKNKGSTESLRPPDENEEHTKDDTDGDIPQFDSYKSPPQSNTKNGYGMLQRASSSAQARAATVITPPLSNESMNPQPSPNALARQSSQPTPPTQARLGLRKRKTDSLASTESNVPKYRTRSMIIVYYDSTVQTAFEDLVKFVSGSRNSMRKGKMNAKMAAMRQAAEREVDDENAEDSMMSAMLAARSKLSLRAHTGPAADSQGNIGGVPVMEVDSDDEDTVLPPVQYVSTRDMGPPRVMAGRPDFTANKVNAISRQRAKGAPSILEVMDVFEEVDKALEWCQSQCERAAHQFLRDGDCSDEIEGIKKKLLEVKARAEREIEQLKKEKTASPVKVTKSVPAPVSPRELRSPQMRKDREQEPRKVVQIDMEVDDDEDEALDLEPPPKLVFKRARDMGY